MGEQNREGHPDGDDLIWLRVGEAIERLSLLTGESESTIQRRYTAGAYPTRTDEETGRTLVGIPSDAPPTREVQLAQTRSENTLLRGQLETQAQLVATLEDQLESATATIADLSGKCVDEIEYRAYLMGNLRMQGEDRAERQILIDKLKRALRGASLAYLIIALVVFLVTALVVAVAAWLIMG